MVFVDEWFSLRSDGGGLGAAVGDNNHDGEGEKRWCL
jgi:hypothetical protein